MSDLSTTPPLTYASVQAAHELIKPYIHETPVLTSTYLNTLASTPRTTEEVFGKDEAAKQPDYQPAKPVLRFWFKCENFQKIGAFKARGAFHAIERLKREPGWEEGGGRERGVVTHSSGNHAQALALAALTSQIPAHIIMPSTASPLKIAATRSYGANLTFSGPLASEREATAAAVQAETGARMVPPFDHPDIILGQGTAGLELRGQVVARNGGKGLDAVITPCGGGGLLSGTALACSSEGGPLVFGAEPSDTGADDARRGFLKGERVTSVATTTIADGLRTHVGAIPWSVIYERRLVRGIYAVSDEEIRRTMRLVYERLKVVVEPSAVVGLAVALWNEEFRKLVEEQGGEKGWDLGVIFSGGNVSLEMLGELIA
ncbi:putative serine racemase [Dichotomopilus funicola]|uniref:Serine racemase n=1 Tax=Dichotomopilus funicola TaxID=1934379 RepID=A0AAN6V3Y5_9PEZI|nr:putative serine racemase [Dichotomopilus funicola]